MANERFAEFERGGVWRGTARELRGCLSFEQRRWRHFGVFPKGEDERSIHALFNEIQGRITLGEQAPNDAGGQHVRVPPPVCVGGKSARLIGCRRGQKPILVVAIDESGEVVFVIRRHTDDMPVRPMKGVSYTREEINSMLGGGVQAFLPTKNGRVVCGCFKLDLNPDAPGEVLVGVGPQREASAKLAVLQKVPFPIFIKRDVGEWEYIGDYRATRYLDRGHKLLEAEQKAKRADVAGILYMEAATS